MMISSDAQFESARVYHDLNSLAQLKIKGKDDNPEAIREAAKQFESIFTGMMLKSMRDANAAIIDEPLFDSSQMGMYQDMYDEQLTLHLSTSDSGLGLTDILVQQLSGNPSTATNGKQIDSYQKNQQIISPTQIPKLAKPNYSETAKLLDHPPMENLEVPPTMDTQEIIQKDSERGVDFSTPVAFVQSLWTYAEQAAKSLQVDPKLLIAQAALETGWGKHVMRTEQGVSSKNLFGIKATKTWDGPRTQINTLELEAGTLSKKKAEFRTYSSYADSFADYALFIGEKPRYQKAMDVASTPDKYAKELQAAGYATDPEYANKIGSIYNSPTLNNALKTLVSMP